MANSNDKMKTFNDNAKSMGVKNDEKKTSNESPSQKNNPSWAKNTPFK